MDEITPIEEKEVKSTFFQVAVCECILALTVIVAALVLKYFFPAEYAKAREICRQTIGQETDINEIISGANDEAYDF